MNIVLTELKKKNTVDTHSELEKQNKNLQDMVSHYKQIIDDTVSFFYIFFYIYDTFLLNLNYKYIQNFIGRYAQ